MTTWHPDAIRVPHPDGLPERFWAKVEKQKNGCWVWTGCLNNRGYGKFGIGGRAGGTIYVHRLAYQQYVGPLPEGLEIDHLCRNRACCNPHHLEAVTRAENCRRGSRTKLTKRIVEQIRDLYRQGWCSQADIAKAYGIAESNVCNILQGKAWA